jgi:hypothetical protein
MESDLLWRRNSFKGGLNKMDMTKDILQDIIKKLS